MIAEKYKLRGRLKTQSRDKFVAEAEGLVGVVGYGLDEKILGIMDLSSKTRFGHFSAR